MAKNVIMNASDTNGNTFMHFAAAKGHYERLRLLIEHGQKRLPQPSFDPRNSFGWTPLMQAVRNGYCDTAKLLIDSGADLTLKNSYGLSLMSLAVASQNIEMVRLVLSVSERIRWRDDIISPLALAIVCNSTAIFQLLLTDTRVNELLLHLKDPITNLTASNYAFLTRNYRFLNVLLQRTAPPANTHFSDGHTSGNDAAIIVKITQEQSLSSVSSGSSSSKPVTNRSFRLSDSKQIEDWIRSTGRQMNRMRLSESIRKTGKVLVEHLERTGGKHGDDDEDDGDVFEPDDVENRNLLKVPNGCGRRQANSSVAASAAVVPPSTHKRPSPQSLGKILRTHSLDSYLALFELHEIDLDVLLTLSDRDLHEIGIDCEDKRRLFLKLIFKLTQQNY